MDTVWRHLLELRTAPQRRFTTPGQLAAHIDPRTVATPALDLIDQELVKLRNTPDGRLVISMPPQEGKSTRVSRDFILDTLIHNPDTRVVAASYAQGLANRNGRTVRNILTAHPDLGLTIAADNGAVSEWQIANKQGGMLSVGRGAGITGRPADLLVIDDPLKDRTEADSETIRDTCWDWWTDSLSTRLSPGAPVVLILTRWHDDDLAGRLLNAPDGHLWRVVNIPAQADHNPDKGDTDPLGREPGEYMTSARRRTPAQWDAIKLRVGSRTWNALYQGRPTPAAGGIFKREWLEDHMYSQPLWLERPDGSRVTTNPGDELIVSADFAFKDTTASDYVAIGVWLRRGADVYLLDQTRDRLDFLASASALRRTAARWPQAALKLVEDKANGPAVIASLRRTVPGIVPEEPRGGKTERANAVTPFWEAGNVHLPAYELAPWVGDFIEEHAAFPNGAHDDQVDQGTQAVNRLLLQPLLAGDTYTEDDFDDLDDRGYVYSPY